jgi:hypothetical protein
MAKGYFIRKGDKTTCGGEMLEIDTSSSCHSPSHGQIPDFLIATKSSLNPHTRCRR